MPKKENTFLLLSLEEDKAKKLSNVIGSDTCRKILDYLAKKEATETEISKELQLPLSTVHYNLKQLVDAGLVKAEEFHYSEKGKEVNHYSIANKYIIIAPKTTESLASKLRKILPVVAIVSLAGFMLQFLGKTAQFGARNLAEAPKMLATAGDAAAEAEEAFVEAAPQAIQSAEPNIALWFGIGAAFALLTYLLYGIIAAKLSKK
ncbi:winged helix-turn-helix transcriptional regulator [Candidatus Woesearchaeota archaeon]|nr:winged helix-turn-helix transcriptional regulator [Candidatus Woesearchaeota archaeon]